jgi:hypothetical protein
MNFRPGLLPRGFWILLPVLATATLLYLRGGGPRDVAGAGRLFRFPLDALQSCEIRGPDRHVVLRRTAQGWSLDGNVRDTPDPRSVARLIETLQTTERSDAIAGEARDPVYGLDGPDAWRLEVATPDGRGAVTIGRRNPVTGHSYVRDDGDDRVFMVAAALPSFLATLPDALRARDLWPLFDPAAIDTVRVRSGGAPAADVFVRDGDGRWWLRRPADDLARAVAAQRYQTHRDDRRREAAGVVWYRARDHALRNLLSLLTDVRVLQFGAAVDPLPAPEAAEEAAELVVIASGPDGRRHEVAFAGPAGDEHVLGRRDGGRALLVMTYQLQRSWRPDLPSCLHLGLLTAALATADSFALSSPGLGELLVVKSGGGWRVARPAGLSRLDELAGDVVVLFDRTEIRDVRSPAAGSRDPLDGGGPVYVLTAWLPASPDLPAAATAQVRLGVAEGSAAALVETSPAIERAPGGGALFTIDAEILTTLRTFLLAAAGAR